ncbi:MAG TPA: HAMP domain-containing sensor histidine kinase [Syntrophomonadaceae bacterium]|nr:HAMP domain-containing sensor histidine kinase [Syntrophomonadaceae bacterium]
MDTKSRKSKPFIIWLSFFLGLSLIAGLFLTSLGILQSVNGNWAVFKAPFVDYKDSSFFKERTDGYFQGLLLSTVTDSSGSRKSSTYPLEQEGENLKYYAINKENNFLSKNISGDINSIVDTDGTVNPPAGYENYWYFDGEEIKGFEDGILANISQIDIKYRDIILDIARYSDNLDEIANMEVFLAVNDTLVENPYGKSEYYAEQQLLPIMGKVFIGLLLISLLLLIYPLIRHREKLEFDRKLASWSGSMWLEVKIFISLIPLSVGAMHSFHYMRSDFYRAIPSLTDSLFAITTTSLLTVLILWWFYLIVVDLIFNGKNFFTHNSVNSLLNWYQKYEKRYPWQKLMLRRAYLLVAAEVILAPISLMFLTVNVLIAVLIAVLGLYLIYKYLKHYDLALNDFGKLIEHIELMKNGDMESSLELAEASPVYQASHNLNSIQTGMSKTIAEKMKSERMKIDLITNVSHDLKTPLTSIISYVELLSKEKENLPEQVNDYIKILEQKSERLKNLIEDLFDLSKASSQDISLDMKQLDLARLIKQTLADMEEPINDSGLTFRLNIPDEPVYITSDGEKLYRVWENLITNALKYSLDGSRVFVDLIADGGEVIATIKNTANYEMDFSEDEILQRFVRGEESRSSEGSGLGLAIAQSFTEISGGKFSITVDGDLFKVELRF